MSAGTELPEAARFLGSLADGARRGEVLVPREQDPRAPRPGAGGPRRSAVLLLISGTGLEDAALVLEERGHALRSQPGQFSLPGGGIDADDPSPVHAALREAHEETGLHPAEVEVLGAFAPIPMPWRDQRVTPVLGWAPRRPRLGVQDPVEVERVVWAPLRGPGSLTDPARRFRGALGDRAVGPVFDLPDGVFVWGFTAMILDRVLTGLGLEGTPPGVPTVQIPPAFRR